MIGLCVALTLAYHGLYHWLMVAFVAHSVYAWANALTGTERAEVAKDPAARWVVTSMETLYAWKFYLATRPWVWPLTWRLGVMDRYVQSLVTVCRRAVQKRVFGLLDRMLSRPSPKKAQIDELFNRLDMLMLKSMENLSPSERIRLRNNEAVQKYRRELASLLQQHEFKEKLEQSGMTRLEGLMRGYAKGLDT
jgi:hypothetical protein